MPSPAITALHKTEKNYNNQIMDLGRLNANMIILSLEKMWLMSQRLSHHTLELLCPPQCPACHNEIDSAAEVLCPDCWRQIRESSPGDYCLVCGHNSGPFALIENRCHRCQNARPAVTRIVRVGPYQQVLRELILAFKFRRQSHLDTFLGKMLAAAIIGDPHIRQADMLAPIPLHWRRRWSRSYDQAQLLTHATHHALKQQNISIPVNSDLLRIRHTAPQTSMAHSHRLQNLKGAFAVRPDTPIQGKHICLIDDVSTTGTTLRVAARTLIKAGAARVSAAVLAVAAND